MNINNKFVAGLIIGATAGVAAALLLQTEKGKEIVGNIKDAAKDAGSKLKTRMQSLGEDMDEVLEKGKQFAEGFGKKSKDMSSSI